MDLNELNKEQKDAVLYNDGPLLIIAGAGSGKTKALTYKIAYLVENGVDPRSILAITFTNKAANEMSERVGALLLGSNRVFISTFHRFASVLLRNYIDNLNYKNNFTIYDTDDQKKLVGQIIKDFELEKSLKEKIALSQISYCKNHNITLEEFESNARLELDKNIAKIFREYENRKLKLNAVDFDDLLLLSVRLLKEHENIKKIINDRYKYILIDEYQDTNLVQFDLVKLLVGTDGILTVVGDDDQSIYKFRGADITNILSFEKYFKNAKVIKLTQNYRSTNNILEVANAVIKNNEGRTGKSLWSNNGEGEKVLVREFVSDYEEADFVISDVIKTKNYKNSAILYRSNSQSRRFEELCVSNGIPYVLIGGVAFYQRKEVKDIIAYLRLIANKNDDISLARVINVPKRGIGDTSFKKLMNYATDNDISVFDALSFADKVGIKGKTLDAIKNFTIFINKLRELDEVDDMIDGILNGGYSDYLIEEEGQAVAQEKVDNIEELKNKSKVFKLSLLNDDSIDLSEINVNCIEFLQMFLNDVSLVSDTDNINSDLDKLTLMTLHASKGLEYDNIYLIGLNEGIFPSFQAISTGDISDIEEERRLCYVGITRAKKKLLITFSKQRLINGQIMSCTKSRFIDEIITDAAEIKLLTNTYNDSFNVYSTYRSSNYNKSFSKNNFSSQNSTSNRDLDFDNKYSKKAFTDKNNIFKTVSDIKKADKLSYGIGDSVRHIKFGEGIVKNIEDVGRDYQITIDFEGFGEKVLLASFAKLEKI